MALQLCPIANRQRWTAVSQCVAFLVIAHQGPFSARFSYTSHRNAAVVKDKESDSDSGNRGNSNDRAHYQTFVDEPHPKTRVLARLGICRSYGEQRHQRRTSQFHLILDARIVH